MPESSDATNLADQLIAHRGAILEREYKVARARALLRLFFGTGIVLLLLIGSGVVATLAFSAEIDLAPMWTLVGWLIAVCALSMIVYTTIWCNRPELYARRQLELGLERLYAEQALKFSGRTLPLGIRQYAYRGAVLRGIQITRRSGNRYRRANNAFQTVIIAGSLATTTVTSLNTGAGTLKWVAVALSFTVGLSAGFTGYFKYRERAFYLRQTADDLEEQLNAYELGLSPYEAGAESDRIALLTAKIEAIRVAQQKREQQLDQPKASPQDS